MEICTKHGYDIAYDVRNCPACDEIEDLKAEIGELQKAVVKLEEETP